jgi:peptidyl-prolyl cis-trans isomerase D
MESVRAQLQDELAGGASLQDAAAKLQLRLQKIDAIDATGKDASGNDLGIAADAVSLIFSTEPGNPGDITALNDGSYAVTQITSVTEPAVKPLDQVKDQVTKDWIAAKQAELARAKANALVDKLKAGGDLGAEAKALGLKLAVSKPFSRGEGDPANAVDAALAQALFKLKQGEMTIGDGADGPIVARLTGIIPAAPETHPEDVKQLSGRVAQSLAGDVQQQFYDALKNEIPVERDDAQWQSLIEQPDQ